MGGSRKSRYVLVVDNLSSMTRSSDLRKEMSVCGDIYDVERDPKTRSALVEFKRSSDASYAWKKMDGLYMDGKRWKVDYATKDDFKFFGWKWTEGGSPSRSRSRSYSRSPSRSPSPRKKHSPGTPEHDSR